jgi:hypothetical protein
MSAFLAFCILIGSFYPKKNDILDWVFYIQNSSYFKEQGESLNSQKKQSNKIFFAFNKAREPNEPATREGWWGGLNTGHH